MELGQGGGIVGKMVQAWRQEDYGTYWQLNIWTGRSMGEGQGDSLTDSKGAMISPCLHAPHSGSVLPALLQACSLLWSSSPPAFLAFQLFWGPIQVS